MGISDSDINEQPAETACPATWQATLTARTHGATATAPTAADADGTDGTDGDGTDTSDSDSDGTDSARH